MRGPNDTGANPHRSSRSTSNGTQPRRDRWQAQRAPRLDPWYLGARGRVANQAQRRAAQPSSSSSTNGRNRSRISIRADTCHAPAPGRGPPGHPDTRGRAPSSRNSSSRRGPHSRGRCDRRRVTPGGDHAPEAFGRGMASTSEMPARGGGSASSVSLRRSPSAPSDNTSPVPHFPPRTPTRSVSPARRAAPRARARAAGLSAAPSHRQARRRGRGAGDSWCVVERLRRLHLARSATPAQQYKGLVRLAQRLKRAAQAITWVSIALSDFSCRSAGLNAVKFSKSV